MLTRPTIFVSLVFACGCAGSRVEPELPERGTLPPGVSAPPVTVVIAGDQFTDTDPSALVDFRDALAPHGRWEDDPHYGTVWLPSREKVGADFVPYATAGHWTYNQEWIWVSDYEWGWAPFHYGRWVLTRTRGWAWVPGRKYAGAWVVWRTGAHDGQRFVAWGPKPPNWYWSEGSAVRIGSSHTVAVVAAPSTELFAPDLAAHLVQMPAALTVIAKTRPHYPTVTPEAARFLEGVEGPTPSELGLASADVAFPAAQDPSLQRAWLFAQRGTSAAVGARAPLPSPVRLKTFVTGGPKYVRAP